MSEPEVSDTGSENKGLAQTKDTIIKSLFGTVLRVSSVSITLLFGIIFTRLYGDVEFGEFVVFQSVATVLSSLLALGLPAVLLREIASSGGSIWGGHLRSLFLLISLHFVVVVGLIAIAAAAVIYFQAFEIEAITIILVCALVVLNILFGLIAGALTGSSRVVTSSILTDLLRPSFALGGLIAIYLLGIVVVVNGGLLAHVAAGSLLLLIVAGVIIARRWTSDGGRPPPEPRSDVSASQFLLQGGKIAASAALITLSVQIDVLIISNFLSPDKVAHYFAAARLALFVTFFFGIVGMYAEPKVVRMLALGDRSQLQEMISMIAWSGFAIAFASGLAIAIGGGFYLELYGPAFLGALPALWVLVVGQIFWTTFGPAQLSLRAARLDGSVLKLTGLALVMNLLVSILLVPLIGGVGAAIGTSLQFGILGALLSRRLYSTKSIRSTIWSAEAWRVLKSSLRMLR